MSEPVWIDCATVEDVAPPEVLAARTAAGRHVVLRIARGTREQADALLARLRSELPDFAVFYSGSDDRVCITVLPVVARARIRERATEIRAALADYRHTCRVLLDARERGALDDAWTAHEHGFECRFENTVTGQVVEAPLAPEVARVDPYFFALFVRLSPAHTRVAELIRDNFHDACRMLDELGA